MEDTGHAEDVAAVISNTVTIIMSQIIRDFEDFDFYQDELEENCEQNFNMPNKIEGDDISNALKLLDIYLAQDKEEADVIDLQKDTEQLKQMKCELESRVANYEKELEKQKNDFKKFEADPKVQAMRDTIQACKLATRVHFVYKGTSDQCGYGIGPTGKMTPFSFNPKEKTAEEITDALYEIMNSSE